MKGVKKFVTLFSYTVWPRAVKFRSFRGLANRHLFPEFGDAVDENDEIWQRVVLNFGPLFRGAQIFDNGYLVPYI